MKYLLKQNKEDKGILCDKVTIDMFDYYLSDEKVTYKIYLPPILTALERKLIATNNPNIDIPKVVDEVEELADEYVKGQPIRNRSLLNDEWNAIGFVKGYNKSQETHPFSEEDMIEFLTFLQMNYYYDSSCWLNYETDEIISREKIFTHWKEQKPKTMYHE